MRGWGHEEYKILNMRCVCMACCSWVIIRVEKRHRHAMRATSVRRMCRVLHICQSSFHMPPWAWPRNYFFAPKHLKQSASALRAFFLLNFKRFKNVELFKRFKTDPWRSAAGGAGGHSHEFAMGLKLLLAMSGRPTKTDGKFRCSV